MLDQKTEVKAEDNGAGYHLTQFKTVDLGIFTYYIESEGQAVLVDPTFDTSPFTKYAQTRNATLTAVLLTHYHSDYLAGHTQLKLPVFMAKGAKKHNNNFPIE